MQTAPLRSRQGHTQPPANIRFKGTDLGASFGGERGDDHLQIVSCGNDRSLRCFHAVRERTSWEVSQKTSEFSRHQLPVMKGFSLSSANNGCKHDFVSCHERSSTAFLWNVKMKRIGDIAIPT